MTNNLSSVLVHSFYSHRVYGHSNGFINMQIVNTIQDLIASKMAVDSTHVWVGIWLALTSVSDAEQCCVPEFRFQHSDFLDLSEGETDYC